MSDLRFWEKKSLAQLNQDEWESLCDGCGKCCLVKLEDEETRLIHYTSVSCRFMDAQKCRCTVYPKRQQLMPTCVVLRPDELDNLYWMPSSCAYRLLHEGKPLPIWHPLLAGDNKAMIASGNTIRGKVISEDYIAEEDLQDHVVHWVT